jgi:hypothetical protein
MKIFNKYIIHLQKIQNFTQSINSCPMDRVKTF